MPALSAPTDRFGAWSQGPLTGTVTSPPPGTTAPTPPSASSGGGYIPQPSAALPYSPGGGGGGSSDTGAIPTQYGPNPEWGGGASIGTGGSGNWGGGPGTSGNGAGYGMGGEGGISDSKGPGGPESGGIMAFDDGGDVDPSGEGDNDADDQQSQNTAPTGDTQQNQAVDPMQMINQALQYGRSQMGLPQQFHMPTTSSQAGKLIQPNASDNAPGSYLRPQSDQGFKGGAGNDLGNTNMAMNSPMMDPDAGQDNTSSGTLAMEDGGQIPEQGDEGQQPGTGGALPDPRKTMQYLAGAGGASPQVANAMEQRVDPQSTMDPAERKLQAIMAAATPQDRFALMQNYRTKFNAYTGAASAALDQGNLAQAAQHATSAMAHVPTGYKVQFAPAKGGLAVMASKINAQGGTPSQSFAEGGAVDSDNPAIIMSTGSYDDGGEVPEPNAAQGFDPRQVTAGPADWTGTDPGVGMNAPGGGGPGDAAAQDKAPMPGAGQRPDADIGNPAGEVIPSTPEAAQAASQPAAQPTQGGVPDFANADNPIGATPTPTIVDAMSLKKFLQSGMDKMLEEANAPKQEQEPQPGLPGFLSSLGQKAMPAINATADTLNSGVNAVSSGLAKGVNWLTGGKEMLTDPDKAAALQSDQPPTPQPRPASAPQPQAQGAPATPNPTSTTWGAPLQPQGGQPQGQPGGAQPQGGQQAQPNITYGGKGSTPQAGPADTKMQQTYNQLVDIAHKIYGNGPETLEAGRNFIVKGMEAAQANAAKLEQTNAVYGGKSGIAANHENRLDARSANSVNERWNAAQLTVNGKNMNAAQSEFMRGIGQQLSADPRMASDPDALMTRLAPLMGRMKTLGITPRDVVQNLQAVEQAPEPQQGQPQQGSQQQGTQTAEPLKQYNGKWYTKAQYQAMQAAGVEK